MADEIMSVRSCKREAVLKHRREYAAGMRAMGYKRIVRWVPDTANPTFIEEYKRQIAVLAERQRERGMVDFLTPEADVPGWV